MALHNYELSPRQLYPIHSPTVQCQRRNSSFYRHRNQVCQGSDGLSGASRSLVQAFYTLVTSLSGSDPPHAAGAKIHPDVRPALDSVTRVRAQESTTLHLPMLRKKQSWEGNKWLL